MDSFPTNLAAVRDRLAKSQKEVAERLGVSASLISKWEKGERTPDEAQLWELARVYGVTAAFLRSGRPEIAFQPRSQLARDAEERDGLRTALVDAAEQIFFLYEILEAAQENPVMFPMELHWSDQALAAHAHTVRQFFRLNDRITYDELRAALAEQAILVFEWKLPPKLSGLSHRQDLSVIFINATMPERVKLFTLCHELAHLLYHLHGEANSEVSVVATRNDPHEKEANRFATEFLMPQAAIDGMLSEPRGREKLRTRAGFLAAVNRFGVSAEAMFYRLEKAGVVSWPERERFFITTKRADGETPGPRVKDIEAQVPAALLEKLGTLWQMEQASSSKLAEWIFASREDVDLWLASLDEAFDMGLAATDGIGE